MKADFSVGMGRNLAIAEVASHSKLAEDCGFSHLTMIDSQNLSRDVYSMMTHRGAQHAPHQDRARSD